MNFCLLILSLICVPLILEVSIFPFVPDTILDYRTAKLFLAILFSVVIFVTQGKNNLWIKILVGYFLLHHFLIPPLAFDSAQNNLIANLWQYKPLALIFIYYLLFTTVQKMEWTQARRETVLKVMLWVGFISACYVVLQFLNLDTQQNLAGVYKYQAPRLASDRLSGFQTHPNYAGIFVACCLPAAIYLRSWLKALFMTLAVCLTTSLFAIGALCLGVAFYIYQSKAKRYFPSGFGVQFLGVIAAFAVIFILSAKLPIDSGRFHVWTLMIQDFMQRPTFGYGLGSFQFLFSTQHQIAFTQAHNEFFQVCYETGIVGGLLCLKAVQDFLKNTFHLLTQENYLALSTSLLILLIGSFGLFVFQIEPTRLYAVVLAGILAHKEGITHAPKNETFVGRVDSTHFDYVSTTTDPRGFT